MTEYNNVTLVSYNPENPLHRQIYQEIADGLGNELRLKPITEEGLEEMCKMMFSSEDHSIPENEKKLPPRVWIHDNVTYREDPLIKYLRELSEEILPSGYGDGKLRNESRGNNKYPILIYNGGDIGIRDQLRLYNMGFDWFFQEKFEGNSSYAGSDFGFTSSNVVKVVGGIERLH